MEASTFMVPPRKPSSGGGAGGAAIGESGWVATKSPSSTGIEGCEAGANGALAGGRGHDPELAGAITLDAELGGGSGMMRAVDSGRA
jgi:hypothetical protein